jgi:dTDP-4-dehydrorhamnose 3,5-epimerase
MQVERTPLEGLLVLVPPRFGDERGFFCESWSRRAMEGAGIEIDFVQDNHSLSRAKGTVRGLHYQSPPMAQAKLVRCGRGRLLDAAVDARRGSPSYGRWHVEELSFENGRQLLVPAGFLHGFATLEPDTEIVYKCSAPYSREHDGAVRWDSAGVAWGVAEPVLSDKDAAAPAFAEWESPFD